MLNLDVTPSTMTLNELREWLKECRNEISDAYDQDNIARANKLSDIYDAVKAFEETAANESFKDFVRFNMLSESITEEGNNTYLIEVDEMIEHIKKNVKGAEVNIDMTANFDTDNNLIEISPLTIDISFNLEFLDEPQHIVLTYTPVTEITSLDIDSIPPKDYKATSTDEGVMIAFKSISNLADELGETEFTETIEWPFEMSFKSATVEKKFNKNATLGAKIVALLGKDHLIDKVQGYQSEHSSGSNRKTREKKEEEKTREVVRARAGRTRSEILKDVLSSIPGITSMQEFDVPGEGRFFKRIRLTFNGGYFDVFNGGIDFLVKDNSEGFGNQREFHATTNLDLTRNEMARYIKKRIEQVKQKGNQQPTTRPGLLRNPRASTIGNEVKAKYREFVEKANSTLNGSDVYPTSELEKMYNYLLDNERELDDPEMIKINELAEKLDIF
jgi:hypothetical protein